MLICLDQEIPLHTQGSFTQKPLSLQIPNMLLDVAKTLVHTIQH